MKYIITALLAGILFAIASSLYIYHGHHHEDTMSYEGKIYPMDDVTIDVVKSLTSNGREPIICYRESHRNFYILLFQGALALVALTSYGVYTRAKLNRRLQSKNEELEVSKLALQQTNQAIEAGIRYARRIQQAMLPHPDALVALGRQYVLFYQPKDVVSGDFYWVGTQSGWQIRVVADCTGHGVPGAFLATLGINIVRMVIEGEGVVEPAEILARVNTLLIQNLGAADLEAADADGIEMTIVALDTSAGLAKFAGARGYACCLHGDDVEELKGDRITLGHDPAARFTGKQLSIRPGTWCYQYTDGYIHQFGGDENKKLGKPRFMQHLRQATADPDLTLARQFEAWHQGQPQVDDVLVMGYPLAG